MPVYLEIRAGGRDKGAIATRWVYVPSEGYRGGVDMEDANARCASCPWLGPFGDYPYRERWPQLPLLHQELLGLDSRARLWRAGGALVLGGHPAVEAYWGGGRRGLFSRRDRRWILLMFAFHMSSRVAIVETEGVEKYPDLFVLVSPGLTRGGWT